MLDPAILTNVDSSMSIVCEEIFGPAMTVQAYEERAGPGNLNKSISGVSA